MTEMLRSFIMPCSYAAVNTQHVTYVPEKWQEIDSMRKILLLQSIRIYTTNQRGLG